MKFLPQWVEQSLLMVAANVQENNGMGLICMLLIFQHNVHHEETMAFQVTMALLTTIQVVEMGIASLLTLVLLAMNSRMKDATLRVAMAINHQ